MAKKKIGLRDILFIGAMLLVAIAIFINKAVPSKFVCGEQVVAEQLTPIDISTMFTSCVKTCDKDDKECLKTCTGMTHAIVSVIAGSGCQEYCVQMMNALQCPNCDEVCFEKYDIAQLKNNLTICDGRTMSLITDLTKCEDRCQDEQT